MLTRIAAYAFQRFLANTTRRNADNALNSLIVIAAAHQAQITKGIFDFLALEKLVSAVNAVGNSSTQQAFFQHPRLGVGAIQNRNFTTLELVALQRLFNNLHD